MPDSGSFVSFLCRYIKQMVMQENINLIEPMYDNPQDQQNFSLTYQQLNGYMQVATDYFQQVGVDIEEEELCEYFELDIYPFEEFQNGMPPRDKLKFGGDFPQDPDYKVFYLNIKYACLADRLVAYQLLDRFNINFYPIHIQDNRHLRSYYIPEGPDNEVLNLMHNISANKIPKRELDKILAQKRKQDHQPKEVFTWILNENEEDILAITSDNWVYFSEQYQYDIKVQLKKQQK